MSRVHGRTPSNPWREGLHDVFGPRLPPTKGSNMSDTLMALRNLSIFAFCGGVLAYYVKRGRTR